MLAGGACRLLVLLLGYIYPVYCTFKALEKKKPDGVRTWCEYWVVMAVFTVLEQVGDMTVFWLPMYNESKVLFVVWLWHQRTQGAAYVYGTVLAPLLQRHETEIDQRLDEARAKVGDSTYSYYQRSIAYVQGRFVQFVHSLPQQGEQGQGQGQASSYVPRNAHEAAAMAYSTPRKAH